MKFKKSKFELKETHSLSTNRFEIMNDSKLSPDIPTYNLNKLPKHFKKKIYQGFEPRFVIILLTSLFMHSAIFLYLSYNLPEKYKSNITEKVRKQFVNLLLEGKNELSSVIEKVEEESPEEDQYFNLLESFKNEFDNYDPTIDELLNFTNAAAPKTTTPLAERTRVNRKVTGERRKRAKEAIFEEVEKIGLLGVITSESGVVSYAEIADILQFADSTAGDLEKRLAFLTSLRVPRVEASLGFKTIDIRYKPFLLTKSETISKPPSIKGNRIYIDNVRAEDFVEKLGNVKEVPVKKTQKYEEVPSSFPGASLHTIFSDETETRFNRDPHEVREVVLSHYPAIQDCYKQALKTNANLKGKVVVKFVVSPEGNVISAIVVSSSITDQQMIECMLDRILRWNDFSLLHPSANNMAIKQTYVFGF
ncbi:MAG: AgmX/PglI C-terminal domain-containing protein [bacterium]